jgi:uncharacterized membrane protein (DUF373 family)
MNHIHVSFVSVLTWIFTALIVIPLWRTAAIMLREKPIGQALAYDGFGF